MDLRSQLQDHLGDAFRIERELGGGGMSRVFQATEVRLSRQVVIKVLSPELAQGLNAERFEREILMVASLQQANIVPVLAAGDVAGLPYFTMPYVDGESLRNRIGGGMPIDDVVTILRDVAKALAYAHQRGIVHRDIKPDNVLLSGGTAVVTDFGIAKALSASRTDGGGNATLTSVGTSIGTPAYMAPEQVAGDPNLDHRVDLYALGCMAFEMLTGKSPFAEHPPQRMLAAHLSEAPKAVEALRPDCPPSLALLVARLLEKDPADRLGSATEVVRLLGTVATTSSETSRLTPQGRMLRSLAVWAVATLVVWIVAKAAVVGIGLPHWTVTGAVGVMLVGLPVLLLTGWAKWMARKAAASTPTLTPGGTMALRSSGTMTNIAIKANRHLSFRRATRGGLYAMAAFVLLVAGFMVTRAMGVGPAASLFATGSLSAQDKVVLADFTTDTRDTAMAPIVEEAVRAAMSQSNAIRLVSPTDVVVALGQMRRSADTPLDDAVAREVAQRTSAKAILGGRLVPAGAGFLVQIELKNAEDGVMLASFQGTADGATDLLNVVDELTRKLRGKVGESLKSVANTVPLERATTANLDALRLYSEATRANDIENDYDKGVRLTREALALDSTFALAWRKLAITIFNANGSRASADSALEQAVRYSEKLPPFERALVRASYHDLHQTGWDRPAAIRDYQEAYRLDSTNSVVVNNLALNFAEAQQYDSAVFYNQVQARVQVSMVSKLKLAASLREAGQTTAASELIDAHLQSSPEDSTTTVWTFFEAARMYTSGDFQGAAAAGRRLSAASGISYRTVGSTIGGMVALTAGRPGEAARFEAQRDSILGSRDYSRLIPGIWAARGAILLGVDRAGGVMRLDRIVAGEPWRRGAPADRPYLDVAILYARAGEAAKATAVLDAFRREWPEAANSEAMISAVAVAEGEIAMAGGNTTEATAKFRVAVQRITENRTLCAVCAFEAMARAFDATNASDSARIYLERYLAVPGQTRFSNYYNPPDATELAAVRKRLGELYDAAGQRAKAMEQYAAFVEQWSNAETPLKPTVESVRRRIAELAGQEGT